MIPVIRPMLGTEEAEAASRAILSGWVTQGPEVAAFEREFSAYVGAEYACAVSNCTVALHLALRVVGVGAHPQVGAGPRAGGEGLMHDTFADGGGATDEVITVSHSFVATANSIRYCGATPVFVDIDPDTFNIDPALIERAITPRTRAILCVHQMGMPCDMKAILAIGRAHNIPVVEDAACAVGSEILWDGQWEKIGRPHGDIACFSFHPRKLLTTGDGGMLTTNNPDLANRFRLWRQHSMTVPDTVRHAANRVVFEAYSELGYNYRLTDIQAAVGREQLKRIPNVIARRREQAQQYNEMLADIPGIGLPMEPKWARSNWQSYCVRLPDGYNQRDVMQSMLDAEISTRRGIMCAHREPAYEREPWTCGLRCEPQRNATRGAAVGLPRSCDCAPLTCARLAKSEKAQEQSIILPLYHQMTTVEQQSVAAALRDALRNKAPSAAQAPVDAHD